jgi:hypothetical protein
LLEAASSEEMFSKERELVELGPHSYNLKQGGEGGFDYINRTGLAVNISEQRYRDPSLMRRTIEASKERWKAWYQTLSDEEKKERQMHAWRMKSAKDPNCMKKMCASAQTETASLKRRSTMKDNGHAQGTKNSQFGTMWITNEQENRKIKKTDPIPDGWVKGRVLKSLRGSTQGECT